MAYNWIDERSHISEVVNSGSTYYIKDAEARDAIDKLANATKFLGVTTTILEDGGHTAVIEVGSDTYAVSPASGQKQLTNGDVVIYTSGAASDSGTEFIVKIESGTATWYKFGSAELNNLGDLAYANNASGAYTPEGSINVELAITPNQAISTSGTTTGSISVALAITENQAIEVSGTPSGTIEVDWQGKEKTVEVSGTTTGNVEINATGAVKNYTPSGTINVTLAPEDSSFVTGLNDDGVLPTFTASLLTASISGETLTFTLANNGFTQGQFPTVATASALTAVSVSEKTFTGSSAAITFSGAAATFSGSYTPEASVASAAFTGTAGTFGGTFTPDVSVSSAVFTGSTATFSGTFTPAVTVSSATFTGFASTITVSAPRS